MRRSEGFALLLVMMAMLLMSALGAALVLLASSETLIAASYRRSIEAFYAADAMADIALDELVSLDWDAAASGIVRSSFTDGSPDGPRRAPAGGSMNPADAVSMANCGKTTCSTVEIAENATADRPWAADNPVWQLFGYGPLSAITPSGTQPLPCYVIAMVARNPAAEGRNPVDTLLLRAEAFGPQNSHKLIELAVARTFTAVRGGGGPDEDQGGQDRSDAQRSSAGGRIHVLSWREIR